MAFEVKETAPVETGDYQLFTGCANLSVVALNPSKTEQEDMGRKPKEEPVYLYANKTSGEMQIQLDIYLSGALVPEGSDPSTPPSNVLVKHTIWIENSGSYGLYIDRFGRFAKDPGKLDKSARPALNGEVDLVQFLKSLCNLGPKDEAGFTEAQIQALAQTGDLRVLQAVFGDCQQKNASVRCLLGVKDGKYQDVFASEFLFRGDGGSAYLHKRVVYNANRASEKGKAFSYFGPINTLNDAYVPSAYLLRTYSAEAQEAFEKTLPRGTFGSGPGGPGGAPGGAPGAFSGFSPAAAPAAAPAAIPIAPVLTGFGNVGTGFGPRTFGTGTQPAPQPQPKMQPAPVGGDDDLPF